MHTVLAQECSYRKQDYKVYSQDNVYMGEMRVDWDKLNRDYSREIRDSLNEFELTMSHLSSRIDKGLKTIDEFFKKDKPETYETIEGRIARCPCCGSIEVGLINLPLAKVSLICDDCGFMSETVPLEKLVSLKSDWNTLSDAITDTARENATWYDTIQCMECPHREPQTNEDRERCWDCVTRGLAPEDATLRCKVLKILELHKHLHFQ